METYRELKQRQQEEFNAFPCGFAFSEKQLNEEMKRLNVNGLNELVSIGGGGFIRKVDKQDFLEMIKRFSRELKHLQEYDDEVIEMFKYEMANHDYQITMDEEEIFEACDLDYQTADERMVYLFKNAENSYLENNSRFYF